MIGATKLHISLKIHFDLHTGIPSRHEAKKRHYSDRILQTTEIKPEPRNYTQYHKINLNLLNKSIHDEKQRQTPEIN
jgi:hypothetical protein